MNGVADHVAEKGARMPMPKLKVGDKFPNLTFHTAYRENQCVYDCLKGKTVFWILRYIGCTVCQLDIHRICGKYDRFLANGAQVYVVVQSDSAHIKRELQRYAVPFDIICDDKLEFYHALEIEPAASLEELLGEDRKQAEAKRKEAEAEGFQHGDAEGLELQLPAIFLVEENGEVSFAHYATTIVDMPAVDTILERISR